MKLIKADYDRRIAIPGVPGLVRRPVDIDRARTGFANLRSLRIYRFDAGSTIEGHAEEDEVFVVVLAGSIEFTVSGDNSGEESRLVTLTAANDSHTDPCVVYLPPQSAYKLTSKTDAEVAYARATPASGPPSKAFTPHGRMDAAGVTVLLEENTYSQRLRLRLAHINANQDDVDFTPIQESEARFEALVHIRNTPAQAVATITGGEGGPIPLDWCDTAAVSPGDLPNLHIPKRSSALILVVLAV